MDYGDRNEDDGSRFLDEKIRDLDTKPKMMPSQTQQMDENIKNKSASLIIMRLSS